MELSKLGLLSDPHSCEAACGKQVLPNMIQASLSQQIEIPILSAPFCLITIFVMPAFVVCGAFCIFCARSDKAEMEQAEKTKIAAAERKRRTWLTNMVKMKPKHRKLKETTI